MKRKNGGICRIVRTAQRTFSFLNRLRLVRKQKISSACIVFFSLYLFVPRRSFPSYHCASPLLSPFSRSFSSPLRSFARFWHALRFCDSLGEKRREVRVGGLKPHPSNCAFVFLIFSPAGLVIRARLRLSTLMLTW